MYIKKKLAEAGAWFHYGQIKKKSMNTYIKIILPPDFKTTKKKIFFVKNRKKSNRYLLHNISGSHARVWGWAQGNNLPDQNTKAPNIWLDGEDVIVKAFRCHPSYGEATLWLSLVDTTGHKVPGKTKVCHFAAVVVTNEDVTSCQISVDDLKKGNGE